MYAISVVARAVGRSPSTLRRWEREGRIKPASGRDALTKERLYSLDEFRTISRLAGRGFAAASAEPE